MIFLIHINFVIIIIIYGLDEEVMKKRKWERERERDGDQIYVYSNI